MAYFPPPFYPHTQEWSFSQTPTPPPPPAGSSTGNSSTGPVAAAGSPRVKPGRTVSGLSAGSGSGRSGRNWGLGIKTHGILNGAHTEEPQSGIPPHGGTNANGDPKQSERAEHQTYSLNDSPRSFKDYLIPPISAHPHLPATHLHNLNHQPSSTQPHYGLGNGTYASSPIQASPIHHNSHLPGEANPTHPQAHPTSTPKQTDPEPRKYRRGILLPAHYHLTPGSIQAAEWARKFGRFGFEGEVVLRCEGGGRAGGGGGGRGGEGGGTNGAGSGVSGNARGVGGSWSGWGIWVVDKWSVSSHNEEVTFGGAGLRKDPLTLWFSCHLSYIPLGNPISFRFHREIRNADDHCRTGDSPPSR